jgi:hypothetical protein
VRELTEANLKGKQNGTQMYKDLAQRCLTGLKPAMVLTSVEEGRPRSDWSDYSF